jgi:hypothetical protein
VLLVCAAFVFAFGLAIGAALFARHDSTTVPGPTSTLTVTTVTTAPASAGSVFP